MGKFYYSKNKVLLSKKRALLREKRIAQGLQNLANTVAGLGGRYWTKERILADALKYKTRNQWAKASGSARIAAKKLGIYEEAVKHMSYAGNNFRRCVYTILLQKQKIAYVGLTFNFERRIYDHLRTERFRDLITLYERNSIETKKITEYIPIEEARKYETKLINDYETNGWRILNKTIGGEVGATANKWPRERILKTTNGYKSFRRWREENGLAYDRARRMGNLLEEIRKILPNDYNIKPQTKWTKEAILKEALKFKTQKEFRLNSLTCYQSARKYKIFHLAVKHMPPIKPQTKWTKEYVLKEALRFKTLKEFRLNSKGCYQTAIRYKILHLAVKHMPPKKPRIKWSVEAILKEALKFKTQKEFRFNSWKCYDAARRFNILHLAVKHMPPIRPRTKWTDEAIYKEALKFKSLKEFRLNSVTCYNCAKKYKIFHLATKHMTRRKGY